MIDKECICLNCGKKFIVHRNRKYRGRIDEFSRRRESRDSNCEICGFDRYIEICHIIPSSIGGGYEKSNILFLCPNHHRLFDNQLLNKDEWNKISNKVEISYNNYGIPLKYRLMSSKNIIKELKNASTKL